ncbi:MAG: hypothetical protein ACWA6X_12570 [Bauldia sp.]
MRDFLVTYGSLISGICGLLGSALWAFVPLRTWRIRRALAATSSVGGLPGLRARLEARLRDWIERERALNGAGAVLLFISFLALIGNWWATQG